MMSLVNILSFQAVDLTEEQIAGMCLSVFVQKHVRESVETVTPHSYMYNKRWNRRRTHTE